MSKARHHRRPAKGPGESPVVRDGVDSPEALVAPPLDVPEVVEADEPPAGVEEPGPPEVSPPGEPEPEPSALPQPIEGHVIQRKPRRGRAFAVVRGTLALMATGYTLDGELRGRWAEGETGEFKIADIDSLPHQFERL